MQPRTGWYYWFRNALQEKFDFRANFSSRVLNSTKLSPIGFKSEPSVRLLNQVRHGTSEIRFVTGRWNDRGNLRQLVQTATIPCQMKPTADAREFVCQASTASHVFCTVTVRGTTIMARQYGSQRASTRNELAPRLPRLNSVR